MDNGTHITRRMLGALTLLGLVSSSGASAQSSANLRLGHVNCFTAATGMRRSLRRELLALPGAEIPGCQLYKTAIDAANPDLFWTFEIWENEAAHTVAIATPSINASIERLKGMVTKFQNIATFYF